MSEEKKEVKVKDKRKFDDKGNLKDSADRDDKKKSSAKKKAEAHQEAEAINTSSDQAEKKKKAEQSFKKGEVDFVQFILTLYTSVLVNLGQVPDPVSGETREYPEQAKDLIDIIVMLKEKTEGNLEENELQAIEEIIFQARMMYLKVVDGLKV